MSNWKVIFDSESVKRTYIEQFRSGKISKGDNKIILKWIEIVEKYGPEKLLGSGFWNDHALDGQWLGYRSSSFSELGRIVYKVMDNKLVVSVVRITEDHNYKT